MKINNLFRGLPSRPELEEAVERMTFREWFFSCLLLGVVIVTTLIMLTRVNNHFLVEIPARGGNLHEGIIGTPSLVNPVLAASQADKDVSALVYAGLMRKNNQSELTPDLAESFTVSEDGRTYTFILRDDLKFHDKTNITSADVAYTIHQIQNPLIKSPRRLAWDNIEVETPDEKTVKIILPEANSGFLEKTTLGIIPMHVWQDVPNDQFSSSELNTKPIGSGPYKVVRTKRHSSGLVYEYRLRIFKNNFGTPMIPRITLSFYDNADNAIKTLENNGIDMMGGISPENASSLLKEHNVMSFPLPRVFGLFFNQNQTPFFADKNIRTAIAMAIDTDRIANEVLSGYAEALHGVLPQSSNSIPFDKEKASQILDDAGWKKGADGTRSKVINKVETPLEFTISTGDAQELSRAAEVILEDLRDIGIKVFVKPYELGLLNQTVIRPRKYDALLFGQVISQPTDLYAFWHSSQRTDPGLNVALYTGVKVDKALESALREKDPDKRNEYIETAITNISKDIPAVFLYTPKYLYVVPKNLSGINKRLLSQPQDRFSDIYSWYVRTDHIWKIFAK